MPIYQEENPLATAAGFAGSYLDAQSQARAQQAALAQQQASADAAAQQQAWKNAFDLRGQDNTITNDTDQRNIRDAMFPVDYQGKVLANQGTQAATQGKALSNQLVGATMGSKISQAQATAQEAAFKAAAAAYGVDSARAQSIINTVKAQYAPEQQAAALQDVYARIAGTNATTVGTQQRTAIAGAEEPLKMQGLQLGNENKAQTNRLDSLKYSTGLFDLGQKQQNAQFNSPQYKALESDYHAELTQYGRKLSDWTKAAAKNPKAAGPRPQEPLSPTDFQATISDTIADVRNGGKDPRAAMALIDAHGPPSPKMGGDGKPLLGADGRPQIVGDGTLTAYQVRTMKQQMASALAPELQRAFARAPDLQPNFSALGAGAPALGGSVGGQVFGGSGAGNGPFSAIIANAASQYKDVPGLATIAHKVIGQESGGKINATSNVGARGLMQLMPDTARGLGVTDITDPSQNIHGGVKYLAQMYRMFGSWPLALAAYNAGPGNVQKYGMGALRISNADPNYVQNVMRQA